MSKEAAQTEKEMREAPNPWPKTFTELDSYIQSLVEREHDYGTCVYAMSLAATAAFNFVASKLGTTGFQASCADLDFLKRSRAINGPFALIRAENMLYPQYSIQSDVLKLLNEWEPWATKEAKKKIAEDDAAEFRAHPDVRRRWEMLAAKEVNHESK